MEQIQIEVGSDPVPFVVQWDLTWYFVVLVVVEGALAAVEEDWGWPRALPVVVPVAVPWAVIVPFVAAVPEEEYAL